MSITSCRTYWGIWYNQVGDERNDYNEIQN